MQRTFSLALFHSPAYTPSLASQTRCYRCATHKKARPPDDPSSPPSQATHLETPRRRQRRHRPGTASAVTATAVARAPDSISGATCGVLPAPVSLDPERKGSLRRRGEPVRREGGGAPSGREGEGERREGAWGASHSPRRRVSSLGEIRGEIRGEQSSSA